MTNKRLIYSNLFPLALGAFVALFTLIPASFEVLAYETSEITFVDSKGNKVENPYLPETVSTFVNAEGEAVFLPNYPTYSKETPGPWAKIYEKVTPDTISWVRKDGLEDIRVLIISPENPFEGKEKETNYISALYLLDKDGLIIGYRSYNKEMTDPIQEKFILNGILNYVDIYVEYGKHTLWREPLTIDLKK